MLFFLLNSTQIPSLEAFIIIYELQFLQISVLGNKLIGNERATLICVFVNTESLCNEAPLCMVITLYNWIVEQIKAITG